MSAVALAIFDLDGTLVDSAPDIARAVALTLREAGVPAPPLDAVKRMVGDGARALIGRALGAAGAQRDEDALLARFLEHYRDGVCVDSRVYDGIPQALEQLRSAGVATAVVTNKPGGLARDLLNALGLGAGWLAIVGDGDGFARKPDPSAGRDVMTRAGASPDRTAVVGDGLPDIQLARALGVRVVSAGWGYLPRDRLAAERPDLIADTPSQALAALLG